MNPRSEARAVLAVIFLMSILVTAFMRKGETRRKAALMAAWLVPGLGHVVLGRWKKGLFFFSILAATYLMGMWIAGFRPVSWDDNPFYYVGQFGSGITYLLARGLAGEKAFPREGIHPSWFDPGLLYVCVVGLLNLVVVNVLDVKPPAPAPAPAPVPEAKT